MFTSTYFYDSLYLCCAVLCFQGTIVCQEYAIRRPVGLKGMVLDGALSDAKLYIETQWRDRISKLPSYTQQIMKNLIESKDFENPSFTEINNIMSRHFTCRVLPRPVVYDEIIKKMNPKIYSLMQGDCEFMIGGVLKEWTITAKLNQVNHNISIEAAIYFI